MAQGNPRYSSEDGLILNAEGAEILGVPTGRTALTVKNGVTQVALPYSNSLRALVLETESLEDLPEINYARLSRGCRIVVPDELLTAYLTDQREMLQRTGLSVIPASQYDPRQDGSQSGYVLRDDCLLTSDLRLHQALRESAHWLALPDGITGVEAGALSGLSDGLEVLILPQGTRAVGYQTFRNCWNLEGVLIERRGAFLLSKNAFEGSASLRFVASNAPTMILEDPDLALFNNDISLEYSFLYCLGDNSGYNSNWTSLMDADHYELLNCGGTRVLYAVTENGTPFAALRSGGKVSGDVALPVTTTVVFRGAFMGAKSTGGVDLGNEVFYSCRSLTTVRLGEMRAEGGIFHSAFSGSGLQELILEDTEPPKLIYYAQGYDFYFEYDQEAAGALHITVPAGSELDYVRAWRCNMAGYVAEHGRTAFQSMGEGPADQLFFDFFREPTVEEIREAVDARLLAAENRTRALLGLDPVEAMEWNYTYTVDEEGFITLTGVGDIGSETDLTAATVDLPYAWCLDYIAADAFQNAPQLRSVFLPEGLAAIRANAFRGVTFDEGDETDGLILYLNSVEDIFDLTPEGLGVPFTFGVADDRIRVLSWDVAMGDEEAIAAFVQQWTLPLAGYADLDELEAAVRAQLGESAALAQVRAAMEDILLPAENRVRTLLEYVDETDRLTFSFTLEGEGSTLPDTDPNLPDLPPAPPQGTDGSGDEDGDGTGGTSGSDGGDGSNGNDTGNTETEGETAQ
ncbi:MAG: leucine-rich repeat protein [Clostridia bacterium]|nr:leucine-rich repeat protein [Clostridia bacterium]MDY2929654.1 leucine-rich repeat protein [Clostridiaceae bacterium]